MAISKVSEMHWWSLLRSSSLPSLLGKMHRPFLGWGLRGNLEMLQAIAGVDLLSFLSPPH